MNIDSVLESYKFPEDIRLLYSKAGLNEFYPPQSEAVEKGALEGKNLVLAVPTAAGKTLIAELCMLRSLLERHGRCLYIVPLKALASEKFEDFKARFSPLGIKVGLATGDSEVPPQLLSGYHILIATAEKVDALLRARTQWLINGLNVVVLDEIHFINDGERGPTLEILTARIKQLNPQVQLIALSATVNNSREIAEWLEARLVESNWRPIPLKEGIFYNDQIQFHQADARNVNEDSSDASAKLALDALRSQGQALVFVNSRRSAQAASRIIAKNVAQLLTTAEQGALAEIAKRIVGAPSSTTKICRSLADTVAKGVAFHHAGLKAEQRKLIEDSFKKNIIKVICSTPTLAAGVNLPARRSIIRDIRRFENGLGSAFIPVSEYKQCAGRAGRPQYDQYGEAVIIARSVSESKALVARYIKAEPEPIISKLNNKSALRTHILASIVGGYVDDINDTFDFMSHTFLAHQKRTPNLIEVIGEIFDFLLAEEFIEKRGFRFYATPFGQYTSRLYIDPASSLILRDGLSRIAKGKSFSSIGLLHLVSCCPDSPLLHFNKTELENIEMFSATCQDELILTVEELPALQDIVLQMAAIKTTMMLSRWIEEETEEQLCDEFNIGPGDIYRHTESTRWLLYAAMTFAELFQFKKLTFLLNALKARVQYGIREELVALTKIRGVGRVRARQLFNNGYKHPTDLKQASLDDLAAVEKIGKNLAQDILLQVTQAETT